ncbi:hemolysin family protein [Crenobacter sp. SG2303]|uniref:Hemolysin family protein n=1 Tax=Crenobacter oryzisoli TaxID=3056844 RepID=A0ABT7XUT7_9NEIS|nr:MULTISPECIES: hemolysin family protein [unclassified Crenobacter]MDN0077542.1 hemolysin family protein [Crenobacter sp. SG2303]MDN0081803.1 hemolysin family protein [Crenobacter sp. SG2305]
MESLLLVIAAFALVALNGFFVAAEFALVKLRQTRVRALAKHHGIRGRLLIQVHSHLDAYLSACQLGITLASLGLGWIGEPAFAKLLAPLLESLGIQSAKLIHAISFSFAFFTISYLHIVVGELAPKSMAIRRPENVSVWTAAPLYLFYWLMYPAIWVLNTSANVILKLAGLDSGHSHESQYSSDELKLILRSSRTTEKFTRDEWVVMAHTLDFGELQVSDLMRPIGEVTGLYRDRTLEENLETIYLHRFSRYPYFDRDGETVLGVIHLKDLFLAQKHGKPLHSLEHYLRPIELVTEDMPALELLRLFRKGAPHFAVVGYKGQNPIGFLTLDNLLSALVGQIRDEFRQDQNDWTRLDDDTLIGKGSLPLFSLERALGIDIDNDTVESVGGLVMDKLGDLPKEGQKVDFEQFSVVVKKMKGPRIVLVRVYPKLPLQSLQ